jgi:4-amino-4-deoxy-L-arabinose transferase-like glycosyltransferase
MNATTTTGPTPSTTARPLTGPRGRTAWRYRLPVYAILALATHLPAFTRPFWTPDEGFLAVQAGVLNDGGELYEDVVDRKPPIVPYLYAMAFRLAGDDAMWAVRLLAVAAHVVTALLLAAIGRRRWGRRAGFAAGALYLVGSAGLGPEDAQAATFEVFMLPWIVAAVLLAEQGRSRAAGAALAMATLTKQVAGAALLPVLFLAYRNAYRNGGLRDASRASLGFALPMAAAAVWFGVDRFAFWVVTSNGNYLDPGEAIGRAILRALGNFAIFAAGNLAALALACWAWRRFRRLDVDLWLWLASAVVAVAAGFHFFGHYYLQLLPPIALLAASALAYASPAAWRGTLELTRVSVIAFAVLALVWPADRLSHVDQVAAAIRERTRPDQRILVWGMYPETYWAADRKPATRFLTAGFLTNFSGGRGASRVGEAYAVPGTWSGFERDIAEHPPALIVDDSRGAPYRPERIPRLNALLSAVYERAAEVDGTVIYERRR